MMSSQTCTIAYRDLDTDHVHSSIEDNVSSNRQAKFAWYYMTTTITSTSTSTSTSTTFTGIHC